MANKHQKISSINVISKKIQEDNKSCICFVDSLDGRGVQTPKYFEVPFVEGFTYTHLPVRSINRIICFDECNFYQNNKLFVKDQYYYFTVVSCHEELPGEYVIVLLDRYGRIQEAKWHRRFPKGRILQCKVLGFVQRDNACKCLCLDELKMCSRVPEDSFNEKYPPMYHGKRPERWFAEVQGRQKHLYGAKFTCSCCHRDFGPKQGYKLDFDDLVFCLYCSKIIFERDAKQQPHIIYTPMGNKR